MIDEHRGRGRHDTLMRPLPPDEDASGWMISYMDVMTLLVASLVLIITLGELSVPSGAEDAAAEPQAWPAVAENLGVPLPEPLRRVVTARNVIPVEHADLSPRALSPRAISVALGVAGLPTSRPSQSLELLARPSPDEALDDEPPARPEWLLSADVDLSRPIADYLLVLTDRPPSDVEEVDEAAIEGARLVSESLEDAPYLADLEGMEVSRIPEGVRLRVEDRLLFPTAEAELTEEGQQLVSGRLRELVERHSGEVAVEGHSDSRPINTERFPSNWALSSARAIAIVEALVEAGVEPSRLRAVGLADTRPLESNDTAEGRARNRRVEVVIQTR
ncbi:OmpA/MotB family protein [Halomonas daqiaonensis]|uniref:Chemotaxis protein MotB n=1 Tax=Halomonas daqiaonensis TaxID=650850 RepID=A0A1H7SLE8_9GAMM|nr:flagellar motor protein MotB [Halomonas daqiaonensis]SEL73480.1 chemotaxis protein MotB [Halomonas daqiaonensis]